MMNLSVWSRLHSILILTVRTHIKHLPCCLVNDIPIRYYVLVSFNLASMGQSFSKDRRASSGNRTILPLAALTVWPPAVVAGPVSLGAVRVVFEKNRRFYLVAVVITNTDSIQAAIEKIRANREEVIQCNRVLKPLRDIFWGQHTAIATLSIPRDVNINLEFLGPRMPLEVRIKNREPCPELDRPGLLDVSEPFMALYSELLADNSAGKVVLVEKKLKKHSILWCAMVAVIIAVVIGCLVGIISHNLAAGIGTSAGIIGAIAFLVPLATWAAGSNRG
ncbi:hypothetical protein F4779DRAFT_605887 [Xylariaceae sp. FL0662B]|nr:hypothetical protein F4779DRAFT_605887 [Xylariaceae sp. FL0662B]